jgi:hypothetical protein
MSKRGSVGNSKCQFYNEEETILHMFFTCAAAKFVWSCVAKSIRAPNRHASFSQFFWWFPNFFPASRNVQIAGVASICWAIWMLRNKACYEGKLIHSPIKLICYDVVFMKYWAGLNNSADREMLVGGADALSREAMNMVPGFPSQRRVLQGGRSNDESGEIVDAGHAAVKLEDA